MNRSKPGPVAFVGLGLLFTLAAAGQTGVSSPATASLDTVMKGLLAKYSIPGGALAISRNGALVYARGFGVTDVASAKPVQPDSLFRVASVSKTFTAVAILELVQQGKIQLDQSAFGLLPDLTPVPGATLNPQLASVTVRELLNMTGGWDRATVPDPIDNTLAISKATGFTTPLSCSEAIRYMLGQPLQHAPGSTYAYSNFGYCVLGQIISEVSGMTYEDFIRQNVLQPLGIQRAKQAEGLMSDTVNGEVTYYDAPGSALAKNVYVAGGPLVPAPYGNHDFIASNASGGWVTTPIDLLRFVNGIDGLHGGPLLQPATVLQMETEAPAFGNAAAFYGLGFAMHTTTNGGFNWNKDGALAGTAAYLYKGANKVCFAVIFNSSPAANEDDSTGFEGDYVNQIEDAMAAITNWPTTDQFASYNSTLVQPQFSTSSPAVENAASFLQNITPGSWVSLYGTNLATATRIWYDSEFNGNALPFSMDGVSVLINGLPAPVYYVSPAQIDVQAPLATVNTDPATVTVTHDGQTSATVKVKLLASSPAMFTYGGGGNLYAAAVLPSGNIVGDPAVVPGTVKAKPNDFVSLYCNSVLSSMSGVLINPPVTLRTFPTVTIGGISVPVSYAGLVGPGLFQINVQLPPNMPSGNQQVLITYNSNVSQNGVVLPVQ